MAANSFRLGDDGIYRCDAFQQFVWQKHGFGTREHNPECDITLKQVHSGQVINANGVSKDRSLEGDALITDCVAKCIGVRSADCVPILLLDAKNRAVAAVHAGWRGSSADILRSTVQAMARDFETKPADVYAAIGPCIRGCCYEVGPEVAERFSSIFPEWGEMEAVRRSLNLPEANKRQMRDAGIHEDRIFDCELCTTCQSAQFFSYRREPENPGRMVAAICRLA